MSVIGGFFIGLTLLFGSLYAGTLNFLHISQTVPVTQIATSTNKVQTAQPNSQNFKWVPFTSVNDTFYKFVQESDGLHLQAVLPSHAINRLFPEASSSNLLINVDSEGRLTQFAKDNSHVFYFEEGDAYGGLSIQTITGADPATFEILNNEFSNISAKDKNHMFGCLEGYDGCNVGIVQPISPISTPLTETQALELVKARPEMQEWLRGFCTPLGTNTSVGCQYIAKSQGLKTGGYPVISVATSSDPNSYSIHVYEDLPDHISTFNWYTVSKDGVVTAQF